MIKKRNTYDSILEVYDITMKKNLIKGMTEIGEMRAIIGA